MAHGDGILAGCGAIALSLRSVGGSEEVNVGVENSENDSSEDDDKKKLQLSDSSLKTGSITVEELNYVKA